MIERKTILIAPLNWGLGHASRCVPLINDFISKDFCVHIASDGEALELLKLEFPDLKSYSLASYKIRYGKNGFGASFAFRLPLILYAVIREYFQLKKILRNNKIDIVLSDNRLGMFNSAVKSIYMTHQLNIITQYSLISRVATFIHGVFIRQYDEIWVPDVLKEEDSLSGLMGHNHNYQKVKYIGAQSRLTKVSLPTVYDIAIILSGPEPQRTIFERLIVKELSASSKKIILIRGSELNTDIGVNWEVMSIATSVQLQRIINSSNLIIARAGYSSIMDFVKLEKKAILVPTPGQTEQEYLSKHLINNSLFTFQNQESLDLNGL